MAPYHGHSEAWQRGARSRVKADVNDNALSTYARPSNHDQLNSRTRVLLRLCVAAGVSAATMGVSCDSDAANAFRQEATGEIGEGVRQVMNGVLDGLIAAVENAGNSSGTDDTATN